MTKLQITLTDEETQLLSMRAAALGYDVTKYAKFVLAQEAMWQVSEIPTFQATSKMENVVEKALRDELDGKVTELKFRHDN
jgi:hypothetical protein